MERITSRHNPVVARYRDAARGQVEGVILLDGPHLVREAISAHVPVQHVLAAREALDGDELPALLDTLPPGVPVAAASSAVMDAVSPVRSSSTIVALANRPSEAEGVFESAVPLVVVACDVQDPGNVGAIVRVAEAAGATGVVVAGRSADPFGWKALRGSMGSALRLPLRIEADLHGVLDAARRRGLQVVATVPRGGTALFDAPLTVPSVLLIGAEGAGLPPEAVRDADLRVTIPMAPPVESLNAAVAAAVLLYEARRQRTH